MATSLTTRIALTVTASMTDTSIVLPDGSSPIVPLNLSKALNWASGTVINTADRVYMKRHSIATGTPLALDLSGALTDLLGNTITMAKVTGIIVINNSLVVGEILSIGAGSNPLLNWIGATGDLVKVGPGGFHCQVDPSLAAYAVTGGTGDVLTIAAAAGAAVSVDVVIFGRSA